MRAPRPRDAPTGCGIQVFRLTCRDRCSTPPINYQCLPCSGEEIDESVRH